MTLGEKLAVIRKENNLTQEQFAELLGVSRQSVSKWELNSAYPETEKLIRISKVFGCSLDYLLKDEIQQADVTLTAAGEEAHRDWIRAVLLTYLSFPPVFGWMVGIFSLLHQHKRVHSKKMTALTVLGMAVSAAVTAVMIAGVCLGL
ncbi:MAG: helix-turn-helix domain-containing protein [Hominenteromicrobium sp.]